MASPLVNSLVASQSYAAVPGGGTSVSFGPINTAASSSATSTTASDMAPFMGNGNVSFDVNSLTGILITEGGGNVVAAIQTNAGGTATVTYDYTAHPALSLVKLTNGTNNDSPTGPLVPVGSLVTWTYNVTNTGDVKLFDVAVTDDNGTPGDTSDDIPVGTIAEIDPGATKSLTATGIAKAGQYTNIGTASGRDKSGTPVTASNPDNYFGAAPNIALVKMTNGTDNDSPTGPLVPVGSPVTWTYIVTNTGNVTLFNVSVTDDNGTPGNTSDDFTVGTIASLAQGASVTMTATGIAKAGQYTNMGTVVGTDAINEKVTSSNPDNYFGVQPISPKTPGYWKQSQHFDAWKPTGYTTSTALGQAFGVTELAFYGLQNTTMLTALSFSSGSSLTSAAQMLMRNATAALLNASISQYPISASQVISMVNTALHSHDRATILALSNTLDGYNNINGG